MKLKGEAQTEPFFVDKAKRKPGSKFTQLSDHYGVSFAFRLPDIDHGDILRQESIHPRDLKKRADENGHIEVKPLPGWIDPVEEEDDEEKEADTSIRKINKV